MRVVPLVRMAVRPDCGGGATRPRRGAAADEHVDLPWLDGKCASRSGPESAFTYTVCHILTIEGRAYQQWLSWQT